MNYIPKIQKFKIKFTELNQIIKKKNNLIINKI